VTKLRDCLRCGDAFKSEGAWNRRCQKCRAWEDSADCPYNDGNFLYAITSDDAETIQQRRQTNTLNAIHLKKK